MDNIKKIKKIINKIETEITNKTTEKSQNIIKNIVTNLIGKDHHPLYIDSLIKCSFTNNITIQLSNRFIFYYDIVQNLTKNTTNIINILPYFWYKTTDSDYVSSFTRMYSFFYVSR